MTPEAFLETFDQLAEVPGAVARLREVILELAVRGQLTRPCDARTRSPEGPEALPRSVARGADSGGGPERPFAIPLGWKWTTLEHLGDTKPRNDAPESTRAGFVPMPLIPPGYGRTVQAEQRPWGEIRKGYTHVRDGDVVLAKITPCFENGKSAVISGLPGGVGAGTTELHVFRRRGTEVLPEFVCTYLKSGGFIRRGIPRMAGSAGQKRVPYDYFARSPFPLPPLAEQERIVARVDELMVLCDRLEALQQEREQKHAALARAALARFNESPTPANLEFLFHTSYDIDPADLRKAILTLAVQGKLVPQNPSDEPAEGVVCRGEAERPRPGLDGVDEPVAEAELPWSLPLSWRWARLGTIANIRHGYAFSSESFTSEPTPYVLTTPGNFHESGGFRDRGANTRYFRGVVPPSFVLNPGDLIIPMTEQAAGLLGSPAFIPDDGKTYVHNQRLGKLEFFSDGVAPGFAFWFFNSGFFRGELARTCTGMKVRHTSPKRILKVPFPVPPLAEQRRIVAKVDHLMALVDQLEAQFAAARTAGETLMAAAIAGLTGSA